VLRVLIVLGLALTASGCPSGVVCGPRDLDPEVISREREELRRQLPVTTAASAVPSSDPSMQVVARAR
jgi:hypothetical protein